MKYGARLLSLQMCLAVTLVANFAFAEKMDVETHTMVIEKLETALKNINDDNVARNPILLRLADLYAERARLEAMNETNKECQGSKCPASHKDRETSLSYYGRALPQAPDKERDSIILQMTHLHELLDQPQKAVALYNKSIAEGTHKHSKEFLAQAYAGLGEISYKQGKPSEALRHYQQALAIKECPRRGLVEYRVAWSQLNLGQQKQAVDTLVKILKNPSLLQRESADGPQVDTSFAEDVSRDLATFLARGDVTAHEAKLLRDLSPEHIALENTIYLGSEAERLGNKTAALYVFNMVLEMKITPQQRLDAMIHVAQVELDMGHRSEAITELQQVSQYWKKNGCESKDEKTKTDNVDEDPCHELQGRIRHMITDWDRRSRKKYQTELLQAYRIYADLFNHDTEMHYWGAVVARELKDSRAAVALFHQASFLAADEINGGNSAKNIKVIFEGSLLGEIEMAEQSKDVNLREAAYVHYLELNPNGEHSLEVRLQKAQVALEKKQYNDAAIQFHEVARMHRKNQKLGLQAANSAIDALVELKDDARIEKWAAEFAREFPENRGEFGKVSRKASLHLVAGTVTNKQSGDSEVREALEHLSGVSLAGASSDDQISFYKTKLILAERNKDLNETSQAANQLLKIKGLSAADRDYALGRKVWVAESQLDFAQALKISKTMKFANLSAGEHLLRLALLAELAGQNAKSYYEQYLHSHSGDNSLILAKLIRSSKNQRQEFKHHLAELKRNPGVLASLAVDLFLKDRNVNEANEVLSIHGVSATPAGQSLARMVFVATYHDLDHKIAKSRISTRSDAQIQQTVGARLNLIHNAEGLAQYAVNAQDWSLQVLALSLLERENRRLYSDLLALPTPRHLKAKDRAVYRDHLQSQSQPYLTKANDIDSKLKEFWRNTRSFDQTIDGFSHARPEARSMAVTEMRLLADVSGPRAKWKLEQIIASYGKRTSASDLMSARRQVAAHPFDSRAVQKLKQMEEQSGGAETLVVYLEARLDQLQSGGRK